MSSPSRVDVLSQLAEAMVDAALGRGGGGMSGFDAALERYRTDGAVGALALWRRRALPTRRDRRVLDVLVRLQRDLLIGIAA